MIDPLASKPPSEEKPQTNRCRIFHSLFHKKHSIKQLKINEYYKLMLDVVSKGAGRKISRGLGPHLFVKVPRPEDSEVTFSIFE